MRVGDTAQRWNTCLVSPGFNIQKSKEDTEQGEWARSNKKKEARAPDHCTQPPHPTPGNWTLEQPCRHDH